jgi:tripartite-type tricarboxylate transporter receptor subunit TctC
MGHKTILKGVYMMTTGKLNRFQTIIVLFPVFCFFLGLSLAQPAWGAADKYPSKPIRIISPTAPGVTADVIARSVQPFLSKYIGTPVVVENMVGGAFMVGRSFVYRADPDGYTLVVCPLPGIVLTELMSNDPKYKSKEMTPVFNLTGGAPQGIWMPTNSPIKNLADLKAAAQKKEMTCSFAGVGSNGQLVAALMKQQGFNIKPVSYDDARLPLMSQEVDFALTMFYAVPRDEKRIRCIALTAPKRLSEYPDVPTAVEQGFDVNVTVRNGIYGPPGMPADRVKILVDAFQKAVADPTYQGIITKQGLEIEPIPSKDMAKYVNEDYDLVVKALPTLKAGQKK